MIKVKLTEEQLSVFSCWLVIPHYCGVIKSFARAKFKEGARSRASEFLIAEIAFEDRTYVFNHKEILGFSQ